MPRPRKEAKPQMRSDDKSSLFAAVRFLREEVAGFAKEGRTADTIAEYERRVEQIKAGWDMGRAGKNERYLMRAAGVWDLRRRILEKLREADKFKLSDGPTAEAKKGGVIAEATQLMEALQKFRALPWEEKSETPGVQQPHGKSAATDTELAKFFAAVGGSEFRESFLIAEFSGLRGEELGKGVEVTVEKLGKGEALCFAIHTAKCDGDKKGIPGRKVFTVCPNQAAPEVKARWEELATKARGAGFTHKLAPTLDGAGVVSQKPGQRFTNNFRHFVKKAGLKNFSAYSLRHRVSAQAKALQDTENTAIVLGHASTETQRHYARSKRGGGDVSPMVIRGKVGTIDHDGGGTMKLQKGPSGVRQYSERKGPAPRAPGGISSPPVAHVPVMVNVQAIRIPGIPSPA